MAARMSPSIGSGGQAVHGGVHLGPERRPPISTGPPNLRQVRKGEPRRVLSRPRYLRSPAVPSAPARPANTSTAPSPPSSAPAEPTAAYVPTFDQPTSPPAWPASC